MRRAKNFLLRILGGFVLFFFCTGTGYVYRTWECRSHLQSIYIAAPGYQPPGELPSRLYQVNVTRCTLPEQWGGDREPLEGYP